MKIKYLIMSAAPLFAIVIVLSLFPISRTTPIGSEEVSLADAELPSELYLQPISSGQNSVRTNNQILTQEQIESTLQEINIRLGINQPEAALNELNGLLGTFDDMSGSEKRDLLTAYATYFLRNSQNDDARFFYEQILLLPDLDYTNRLAILQMLARIALASEDWEGFIAYNDQYFDEGGGYNWVVTGHLIRAHRRLENYNAAGDALMLQFETGIHPEFDGSDEQYERLYGSLESLPLKMSNPDSALILAKKMVEQFDQAGNWRVLAELYRTLGDGQNHDEVIDAARNKGFIGDSGNWKN
ncbi:MAG: hypothetical protein WD396_11565 [Pseudohongiellaceae bacterium]